MSDWYTLKKKKKFIYETRILEKKTTVDGVGGSRFV